MELVSVYVFNQVPMETKDISNASFHHMKRHGWYSDARTNRKFTILNKRIESEGAWYRAMVRFEYNGILEGQESFILSQPSPFVVTQCEPIASTTSGRWKDNKTFHGPKLGMMGYLKEGVPAAVLEEVRNDLKTYIQYN